MTGVEWTDEVEVDNGGLSLLLVCLQIETLTVTDRQLTVTRTEWTRSERNDGAMLLLLLSRHLSSIICATPEPQPHHIHGMNNVNTININPRMHLYVLTFTLGLLILCSYAAVSPSPDSDVDLVVLQPDVEVRHRWSPALHPLDTSPVQHLRLTQLKVTFIHSLPPCLYSAVLLSPAADSLIASASPTLASVRLRSEDLVPRHGQTYRD